MNDTYLWNRRAGSLDPVVVDLEGKLACKRYAPPVTTRRTGGAKLAAWGVLAVDAAAVLLVLLLSMRGPVEPAPSALASDPTVAVEVETETEAPGTTGALLAGDPARMETEPNGTPDNGSLGADAR